MLSLLMLAGLLLALTAPDLTLNPALLEAHLDGAHVVPPTGSPGTATVEVFYSLDEFTDPQQCGFRVTYANISGTPTGASMRWGREGENGPLAFTLVDGPFSSPYGGSTYIPWNVLYYLTLIRQSFWSSDAEKA